MVIFNNWSNRRRYFSSVVSVYSCKFINSIYLLSSSKIKTKEIKDSHTLVVSVLLQLMDNKKIIDNISCKSKNLIYLIECNKCKCQYIGETKRQLNERFRRRRGERRVGGKCGRKRTWEEGASFLLSPIPFPFLSFPLASALSTPATQATLKLKEQRRTRRAKGPNGRSLSRFPQHGACLGVLLLPPGWDSSPSHSHLNNWVKRDKVEWSSLSKETTRRARLEPQTSRSGVWGVNRSPSHTCLHLHFTPFKPKNA